MKKHLALLLGLAAISEGFDKPKGNINYNMKDFPEVPKDPVIPKGCKVYFFNKNGGFSTDKMRRDEVVFICVAANEKSAKKKFNKYQLSNPLNTTSNE